MSYQNKIDELYNKLNELDEIFSLGEMTEDEYKQKKSELDLDVDKYSTLEWQRRELEKVEERIRKFNKPKSLEERRREFELLFRPMDF